MVITKKLWESAQRGVPGINFHEHGILKFPHISQIFYENCPPMRSAQLFQMRNFTDIPESQPIILFTF